VDEINGIIATVQLIFIRDIESGFHSHFDGKNLFLGVKETFASLEFGWEKLASVWGDGDRSSSLRLA
jgi:hypothetical protein